LGRVLVLKAPMVCLWDSFLLVDAATVEDLFLAPEPWGLARLFLVLLLLPHGGLFMLRSDTDVSEIGLLIAAA
jgi:hypothetical protein